MGPDIAVVLCMTMIRTAKSVDNSFPFFVNPIPKVQASNPAARRFARKRRSSTYGGCFIFHYNQLPLHPCCRGDSQYYTTVRRSRRASQFESISVPGTSHHYGSSGDARRLSALHSQ
jgi:hypothetical protein